VANGIRHLCANLRSIQQEPQRRADKATAEARFREEEWKRSELLLDRDWFAPTAEADEPTPRIFDIPVVPRRPSLAPARLILVDEADRLKVASLEQLRDIFDRSDVGLILIGMPGIEKRLARYPQLYSRVGFVHAFRSLRAEEVRRLLAERWSDMGFTLPTTGISDEAAVGAIIRITGGNFRLIRRLLAQVERLLGINQLQAVTAAVVEAAREGLVIGTA
jgi:AAA domain